MYIVHYKKFMLLQNLMNSDEERTTKKLIQYQREFKIDGTWYNELDRISKQYGISLNSNNLKVKSKWKEYVKSKIREKINAESNEKKNNMTKLRHQKEQNFNMQQYIQNTTITRVRDLIRVKLELLDIGKNQGQENRKCFACKTEDERSEHIIECSEVHKMTKVNACKWEKEMMSDRNHLTEVYLLLKKYISMRDNENNRTTSCSEE